jgi:transposase
MKSFVGIDWSEQKHSVHIHSEKGALLSRFEVKHSAKGFNELATKLLAANPCPANSLVAIETSHNLLVDYLHNRGFTLYILAPNMVSSNRGRQSSSGAKDDDRDARLLADILRTDQGRLIPWQADGVLVTEMGSLLSWIDDLTGQIVAQHNRLRANLLRYYPQPLHAFKSLKGVIALHFLSNYPSPAALQQLTFAEFTALCHGLRYYRNDLIMEVWTGLQQPMPSLEEALTRGYRDHTVYLAEQLLGFMQQKKELIKEVNRLFVQHPDAPIFASLPGAADLLAPKLLVMFGDHRRRYPQNWILPAIAGTCPVTVTSGKSRFVKFRRACNHADRQTAQQFAKASTRSSPWAAAYFQAARARGHSKSHAYRCLANRWLHIIWTLWQKKELYDEAYHLQQVARHRRPELFES